MMLESREYHIPGGNEVEIVYESPDLFYGNAERLRHIDEEFVPQCQRWDGIPEHHPLAVADGMPVRLEVKFEDDDGALVLVPVKARHLLMAPGMTQPMTVEEMRAAVYDRAKGDFVRVDGNIVLFNQALFMERCRFSRHCGPPTRSGRYTEAIPYYDSYGRISGVIRFTGRYAPHLPDGVVRHFSH